MATNTITSSPGMTSQIRPDIDHTLTNGVASPKTPIDEGEDRSSSLSELEERGGRDDLDNDFERVSDAIDTEAETERLEDSPQKVRKHQNVVLTPVDHTREDSQSSFPMPILPVLPMDDSPLLEIDQMEPTSDVSSPADSSEEIENVFSNTPLSPRKRKRSSFEQDNISGRGSILESSTKGTKTFRDTSAGAMLEDSYPGGFVEDNHEVAVDTIVVSMNKAQSRETPEIDSVQQKYHKGKRKRENFNDSELGIMDNSVFRTASPAGEVENPDAVSSDEEVDEDDDAGEAPGMENAVKTKEGVIQKKSALDSLNAMEKCFATLRDKLFEERLTQCNEELALLESPVPTHPELIAMKDVIDQRRDQKIQHERNLLKYKLQALQRESIANKAQAHSQYMQTVREIRDSHLEQLNKNFYQLQRERRNAEGDVPDYMFAYTTKRSKQITQQIAYNKEVSILSGIAKHVGFPAAPDVCKAKPNEIEDDLRNMGISSQRTQALHNHPPLLRAASSFARQRPGADEQFLELNPWANPQHPSHHQQRQQMHRQISGFSRGPTPSRTPAAQKRVVGLTEPQGSSSITLEHPSGPNSSTTATPATGEPIKQRQSGQTNAGRSIADSTPSKVSGGPFGVTPPYPPSTETSTDQNAQPITIKSEQNHSLSQSKHPSQDTNTPSSLPKPLPFMHSSGSSSTPAPRTTTPGRYTAIKAEDPIHGVRHPSMSRYNTPPVSAIAGGMMNRSAA